MKLRRGKRIDLSDGNVFSTQACKAAMTLLRPCKLQTKKKLVLSYELFFKYGGEGGLLGPSLGLAPSGPTQALFKNAPGVFVIRCAHPSGSPSASVRSVQLADARCRTPVGDSHPPRPCRRRKKSPYFRTSSSSNMAVRGGFEPRSGILIPPDRAADEKKARTFVRALLQIWR